MPRINLPSPDGARKVGVHIKVSDAEKAAIKEAAAATYMSLTDFIVWSALYSDQCVYAVDPALLASVRTELARQGNNLNQIARVANSAALRRAGSPSAEDMIAEVHGMLSSAREAQAAAYGAVRELQGSVYKARLRRILQGGR